MPNITELITQLEKRALLNQHFMKNGEKLVGETKAELFEKIAQAAATLGESSEIVEERLHQARQERELDSRAIFIIGMINNAHLN